MELRKTARNALKFGSLHLLFIAVCFIALVPIIYALAISFSGTTNLTGGVFAITDFTFDNYLHIFTELDFGTWLGNSLILSLSTVLVTVIPSAFAAYAFATMSFRGKKVLLFTLLILNAFPQVLTMTALVILSTGSVSLTDFLQSVLMGLSNPGAIFVIFALFAFFGIGPLDRSDWRVTPIVLSVSLGSAFYWFVVTWLLSRFGKKFKMRTILWINRITGAVIIVIGLVLIGEGLFRVLFRGASLL